MPFELQNSANSLEANWLPLSDTIVSGLPNWANRRVNSLIVAILVVDVISMISGHLE